MDEREVAETLEFLRERRKAYGLTFGEQNGASQTVLKDLVKFCHWGATPFNEESARATDVMIGRQQVLLRIQQHLGLRERDLFAIYSGHYPQRWEGVEDGTDD